jgi:hypothetical protein
MGGADIFCILCGNPCHGMDNIHEEVINDYKNGMDLYDDKIYKYIIDAYIKNPNLIKDLNEFRKKTLWMNNCTMLLINNKVEHNCKETGCLATFENENGTYEYIEYSLYGRDPFELSDEKYGRFIHTDCYEYIKLKYNIELKYSNLPLPLNDRTYGNKPIKFVDYGGIEKYWEQDFDFVKVFLNNKQFLCSSPLKNDKNITQIKKNINSMKISNKYLLRPSPPISATFYADDIIKIGNNGKLWTIRNGKWNEIKKEVCEISITFNYHIKTKKNTNKNTKQIHKKQINFFKKLSWIGQYNKYGLFIKNFTVDKNIGYATIVTTFDNKDMIEKLFL